MATRSRYLLQTASDPNGIALDVGVLASHRERARGLLGRPAARPMLFEHARSVHTFGMREAIVVAFLDRNHRVIRVATVPPRRIVWSAAGPARAGDAGGTDPARGPASTTAPGRFAMSRRWISLVPL